MRRFMNPLCVFALLIVHCGLTVRAVGQPAESFCLTVHPMPVTERVEGEVWQNPDRFYREVVRQAVLILAREEFGLPTRDIVLREPMPDNEDSPDLFDIEVSHGDGRYLEYRLSRAGVLVYEKRVYYYPGQPAHPWHVLNAVLNDTIMPLKQALREAGLEPVRRRFDPDGGGATPAMEAALNSLDLASQYTAVRLAHAAIREQGETRDLLVVLVRGYANLSQLTAFHADSARYVFAARALLYATRIPQMGKGYPMGYWARAYASQLFGLTREAAWDLAAADAYVQENPGGPEPPAWVELIELGSRFRYAELRDIVEAGAGPNQELASLLWFRTVETSRDSHLTYCTGEAVWEDLHHSMRLLNGMMPAAHRRRLSEEKMAVAPFEILSEFMPVSLAVSVALDPTMEDSVGPFVEGSGDLLGRAGLTHALVQKTAEGDETAEPSLSVLGRLIEEQDFVLIVTFAEYLTYTAERDAGEFLDSVAGVVADHPHASLLQTLRHNAYEVEREVMDALLADIQPAEGHILTTDRRMLSYMNPSLMDDGTAVTTYRLRELDFYSKTDLECSLRIREGDPNPLWRGAQWLSTYHPYAPWPLAFLISERWERVEQSAADLENAYGAHPVVAKALADQYYDSDQAEDAIRLYEVYLAAASDYLVCDPLARLEWQRGNYDRVEALVDDFLEQDAYWVNHVAMAQDLAHSFMSIGEHEKALPWAERAAQSSAEWALMTYGYCLEGLGRIDESREVLARLDRQYGKEHAIWQCFRTDADLEASRRSVLSDFASRYGRESLRYQDAEAHCALILGEHENAMHLWDALPYEEGVPFRNCLIALMAIQCGHEDVFVRKLEETMQLTAAAPHLNQEAYILFAAELLSLHRGQPLSEEVLSEVFAKAQGDILTISITINNVNFFLANWYDDAGHFDEAIRYYTICATNRNRIHRTVIRSLIRLQELGVDTSEIHVNWGGFSNKLPPAQR